MADKSTQSLRIASEAAHAQQDRRATVVRPRLSAAIVCQPEDLPGGPGQGTSIASTPQGVEALTSLVFVEGLAKPLAVGRECPNIGAHDEQPLCGGLNRCKVELRAVRVSSTRLVRLYAPGHGRTTGGCTSTASCHAPQRPWRALMLFLLAVALIAGLVYAVERGRWCGRWLKRQFYRLRHPDSRFSG